MTWVSILKCAHPHGLRLTEWYRKPLCAWLSDAVSPYAWRSDVETWRIIYRKTPLRLTEWRGDSLRLTEWRRDSLRLTKWRRDLANRLALCMNETCAWLSDAETPYAWRSDVEIRLLLPYIYIEGDHRSIVRGNINVKVLFNFLKLRFRWLLCLMTSYPCPWQFSWPEFLRSYDLYK